MPLFEKINVNENTQLYVWKVSETLESLSEGIELNEEHQSKFDSLKVESAKKNFIATRVILRDLGYSPDDLFYNHEGKPYLRDGKTISISHSFDMVSLIIGEQPVGVDIEKKRPKIIDISEKFTQWDYRSTSFSQKNILQKLTMIWSAKEAGYKAHGKSGITAEHILVKDFFPNDSETKIKIEKKFYDVSFMNIEDYVLAYCL